MAMEARRFTYSGSMKISRSDMSLLRAGRKKCTVRLGTATVADSEIVMTDGRTSVPVRILKVDSSKRFSDLTDQDAMDEGFQTREELWRDLKQYYPRATDGDPVTVIHFERVKTPSSLFPE
jgi:hypothetical protein